MGTESSHASLPVEKLAIRTRLSHQLNFGGQENEREM